MIEIENYGNSNDKANANTTANYNVEDISDRNNNDKANVSTRLKMHRTQNDQPGQLRMLDLSIFGFDTNENDNIDCYSKENQSQALMSILAGIQANSFTATTIKHSSEILLSTWTPTSTSTPSTNHFIVVNVTLSKIRLLKLDSPISSKILFIEYINAHQLAVSLKNNNTYIYQANDSWTILSSPVLISKETNAITCLIYNSYSNCLLISTELSTKLKLIKLSNKEMINFNTKHDAAIRSVYFKNEHLLTCFADGIVNFASHDKDGSIEFIGQASIFTAESKDFKEGKDPYSLIDFDGWKFIFTGKRYARTINLSSLKSQMKSQSQAHETEKGVSADNTERSRLKLKWNTDQSNTHEITSVLCDGNFRRFEICSHADQLSIGVYDKAERIACYVVKADSKQLKCLKYAMCTPSNLYLINSDGMVYTADLLAEESDCIDEEQQGNELDIEIDTLIKDLDESNSNDNRSSIISNNKNENNENKDNDENDFFNEILDEMDKNLDVVDEIHNNISTKKQANAKENNYKKLMTKPKKESIKDTRTDDEPNQTNLNVNKEQAKKKSKEKDKKDNKDEHTKDSNTNKNKKKQNKKKQKPSQPLDQINETDDEVVSSNSNSHNHQDDPSEVSDNPTILGISEIENSEGDLKNPSAIDRHRDHDKEQIPQFIQQESLADKLIDIIPQTAFVNNSTTFNNNSYRFLCFNMIGSVILRTDPTTTSVSGTMTSSNTISTIEVVFSDQSNKKKLHFTEPTLISLACLNNCGVVLASKPDPTSEDEYEQINQINYSTLYFKSISYFSAYNDWQTVLPTETIDNLCMGSDWIAVYCESLNVYIYSLSGCLRFVFTASNAITCMAGNDYVFAYAFHSGVPFLGSQAFSFRMHSIRDYSLLYEGPLCLSQYSHLIWFGFSEEGMLYSFDSDKRLRLFSLTMGNHWIPMMVGMQMKDVGFWPVGVEDGEIYGVELRGVEEPLPYPKPYLSHYKIVSIADVTGIMGGNNLTKGETVSLNDAFNNSKPILTSKVFLSHEDWRKRFYKAAKQHRDIRSGEYYYTESMKTDKDIYEGKRKSDMQVMEMISKCFTDHKEEKVLDLVDFFFLDGNIGLAAKMAGRLGFSELAEKINLKKEMRLDEISTAEINGHALSKGSGKVTNSNFCYSNGSDNISNCNGNGNGNSNTMTCTIDKGKENIKRYANEHLLNKTSQSLSDLSLDIDKIRQTKKEEIKETVETSIRNEILGIETTNQTNQTDNSFIEKKVYFLIFRVLPHFINSLRIFQLHQIPKKLTSLMI